MTTRKIVLKTSTKTSIVLCSDISHCCADGSYTRIVLRNGEEFLMSKSLSKMMQEFATPYIVRISQSNAININFIAHVHRKKREIELVNGDCLRFTIKKRSLDETIARVLNRDTIVESLNSYPIRSLIQSTSTVPKNKGN